MHKLLTSFALAAFAVTMYGQNFQNGDLEGTVTSSTSVIPNNWQYVPDTDPVCYAAIPANATPDLTGVNGPDVSNGINGNPYSGGSFVSGLHATNGSYYWHEGIMQTVYGFVAGHSYSISFFQTVVKQSNCLDTSGSWMVYMGNTLLGITASTISALPYGSTNLVWELRAVNFIAPSAGPVTFKFLPWDDDSVHTSSAADPNGGLRMGIDNINITEGKVGIDESDANLDFFLFPNPGVDQFVIHLNEKSKEKPVQIEVIDTYGNIVIQSSDEIRNGFVIDMRDHENGVYYVRCLMSDNRYIVNKIVKQ